jgi:hypothetical protein
MNSDMIAQALRQRRNSARTSRPLPYAKPAERTLVDGA